MSVGSGRPGLRTHHRTTRDQGEGWPLSPAVVGEADHHILQEAPEVPVLSDFPLPTLFPPTWEEWVLQGRPGWAAWALGEHGQGSQWSTQHPCLP